MKLKISLIPIINDAKIQNWVRKIIGITNSGTTAKNLILTGFKICKSCRASKTVFPL